MSHDLPLFLAGQSRESAPLRAGTVAEVRSLIQEQVREAGSVKAGCFRAGSILGVTDRWARGVLYGERAAVSEAVSKRLEAHRAARTATPARPPASAVQRPLPLSVRGRP